MTYYDPFSQDSYASYGYDPYQTMEGYYPTPERLYQGFGNNAGFRMVYPQYGQQPENPLSGAIKAFAGARYNLNPADMRQQQTLAGQISNLSNAMIDPTDPTYQNIYNQERQSAQQDLASAIMQMSQQNRKLAQMGRVPLFDPERGGEQAFRQLTQGYQTAQDTARQRAREIIGAGIQAKQNAFSNSAAFAAMKDQNRKKQAFGLGNVADALPFLGKLF